MRNLISLIISCIMVISISSCFKPAFIPQTHNTPLFTQKHQVRVNVSGNRRTLELQAAYSPVNHVGFMLNTQYNKKILRPEIAVGGYYCFDDRIIAELYRGYAHEKLNNITGNYYYNSDDDRLKYVIAMDANKFFLQPDVGIKFDEKCALIFSMKSSYWAYSNYYLKISSYPGARPYRLLDSINVQGRHKFTFEPAVSLRYGNEYLTVMFQAGACGFRKRSGENLNPYINIPVFFRVGININLDFSRETWRKRHPKKYDRNFIQSGT